MLESFEHIMKGTSKNIQISHSFFFSSIFLGWMKMPAVPPNFLAGQCVKEDTEKNIATEKQQQFHR